MSWIALMVLSFAAVIVAALSKDAYQRHQIRKYQRVMRLAEEDFRCTGKINPRYTMSLALIRRSISDGVDRSRPVRPYQDKCHETGYINHHK